VHGKASCHFPRAIRPAHIREMKIMNRNVLHNVQLEEVANAIWEGKAIMGTDGSVRDPTATYSFVISISRTDVKTNVKGGGYLPPTAKYLDPYSKRPEAAALLAGLTWIQKLLRKFPNHTDTDPPPLQIPVDNEGVVQDVHRTINEQTPTYDLLSPDYDILQAIRTILIDLPIRTDIAHVRGHQDRNKPWHELDNREQINVLADKQANAIYRTPQRQTGLFPSWIPGTRAALFHGEQQVTKGIHSYIRDAAHTPAMKEYLIRRSNEATGRDKSWDDATYESIDWRHYGEVFKKLSNGRRIQISKYVNDLLPTKRRLATFDNSVDSRCFACKRLWEDTTHVLTCTCDARCEARTAAHKIFQQKLTRMHTPDILSNTICKSMDSWLARRPVLPPEWNGPEEPIQRQIRSAFKAQAKIGWDQFFRGRIAKEWSKPIGTYYKIRQPGESFTPDQWMRTVIKELWEFSITIWKQRNSELHGTDGVISMEQRRKDTANEAVAVYQSTIGKVSPTDSVVLHHARIEEILKWTKEHLDAYLASADVIIDQRDEPG
jgi:hypothetical protein